MAIGKSKKVIKKKGNKKKIVDPFVKKEWYKIRAPALFSERFCGWTPATKSSGTYSSVDSLKNRVIEVCLADLNKDEDQHFRKMKLISEEVQGTNLLCNFYGMDFTRDKLCSLIKKWQTLVEAWADVKTTDGYTVRMFAIGFTKKRQNQVSKTSYAQSGQVRAIRKKMVDIMTAEASKSDLKELVAKFIPESIGKEIEKACQGVYPLQNVFIRKCKLLKSPKFDLTRLMELHEGNDDTGRKVEDGAVEALEGSGGRL